MRRLSGKVAFVTGGGTGIGRACALAFAREGAKVAVAGRRTGPLASVAREIEAAGSESLALECNVTDAAAALTSLDQAEKHFGQLNVVVNNAGAAVVATVENTSDEDWDRIIATNLTGTFLVSRAALPLLGEACAIDRIGPGGTSRFVEVRLPGAAQLEPPAAPAALERAEVHTDGSRSRLIVPIRSMPSSSAWIRWG